MDNIAWHYDPVRASDFFIRADLSNHGMPGRYEQFWVRKIGERTFEISCIPFFTYGMALGDTVETDANFTIERIAKKSGHRTLRIAVANDQNADSLHEIVHGWVLRVGLLHEWYADGYLAVDLPPDAPNPNLAELGDLRDAGELSIEIDE